MSLDVLIDWNRWGKNPLPSGFQRDIVEPIIPWLAQDEIITLQGIRRSGKSTILYQLMDVLKDQGIPDESILHLNFEDPRLTPFLTPQGLDQLVQIYRHHIYPDGKAYLFFDEIQLVKGWERWARTTTDLGEVKLILTGSSAALLSRELGTSLTGRHISFRINPLSLPEVMRFYGEVPDSTHGSWRTPPRIANCLLKMKSWGSLPQIHKLRDESQRDALLRQYLTDILFNDVAMRHHVSDMTTLKNLTVQTLTHTATLTSANRLGQLFNISTHLAKQYLHHLSEAYLIECLSIFTLKTGERQRNPQKIHVLDLGLRRAVSLSLQEDYGRLMESMILNAIHHVGGFEIFYGKVEGKKVDYVLHHGNRIRHLIQVVDQGLHDPKIFARETKSLTLMQSRHPLAQALIITGDQIAPPPTPNITCVPFWQFMLKPARWLN